MKIEDLESLWAGQKAPATLATPEALRRTALPQLYSQRRMAAYGIGVMIFVLVAHPLLTVANVNYYRPADGTLQWIHFAALMASAVAGLVHYIRQWARQDERVRRSAGPMRDVVVASVESLKAEMRDYRLGAWLFFPFFALQVFGLYASHVTIGRGDDWTPLFGRAGFALGFQLLMAVVFCRHYRKNLRPQLAQQQELLRQLG